MWTRCLTEGSVRRLWGSQWRCSTPTTTVSRRGCTRTTATPNPWHTWKLATSTITPPYSEARGRAWRNWRRPASRASWRIKRTTWRLCGTTRATSTSTCCLTNPVGCSLQSTAGTPISATGQTYTFPDSSGRPKTTQGYVLFDKFGRWQVNCWTSTVCGGFERAFFESFVHLHLVFVQIWAQG